MAISNRITLSEFKKMTPSDCVGLSVEDMEAVKAAITHELRELKELASKLYAVQNERYSAFARAELRRVGKNFGTVSHSTEQFVVKCTIPKEISWNQNELRLAIDKLADDGIPVMDMFQYEVKISEKDFNAYPKRIKEELEKARTEKQGKLKVEIVKLKTEERHGN